MKTRKAGPYWLGANECAPRISQNADGTVALAILNGVEAGKEKLNIHHVARDLVRFLLGRPIDEFTFDYVPVKAAKRKLRIVTADYHTDDGLLEGE